MTSWLILRSVEALVKVHAPENWAKSFVKELVQSKKHKEGDLGTTSQYLCEYDIIGVSNTCFDWKMVGIGDGRGQPGSDGISINITSLHNLNFLHFTCQGPVLNDMGTLSGTVF